MFHPVDSLAIELFLNGDVAHSRDFGGAVPVLFTGRKPDHIARPDFLNGPAPTLRPTATCRNDQRLTERVRMPCGAGTRLEGDTGSNSTRRSGRTISGSMRTVPVK